MIERLEIVGADSISALEQSTYLEHQRVDIESQRVDMESTPTQNNVETVGAESISAQDMDLHQWVDIESRQRADMESAPTYKFHRRSLRLAHYDYSRAGYYFITITTQNREHLFGEIVDGVMVLGVAGEMVNELWYDIPNDFDHVALHDFVIMPNHIHGIIEIVGADSISALNRNSKNIHKLKQIDMELNQRVDMKSQRAEIDSAPTTQNNMESQRAEMESQRADMESAPTLSTIVQSFKRHTTLRYIKMVKNGTLPPFDKRIWQRNYYEHVVRDDGDYVRISEYIENNVMTWAW